ncbi:Hypothetical predicted protein [Mytilus galloprovincialis]|uniref:Uncharacterized protein n=1 Tax=Mytilus galloprovincialis TaxID=29158 RepID=A0A8B6GNI3_MYTGA|nr:Hypothetical predicted protein [Mytilus galloprovincialis]
MYFFVLDQGNRRSSKWGVTFAYSLNRCISNNQLLLPPLSYCNIYEHQRESITSWTNVFRDVWKRQLTKAEGGYDHPLQCLAGELVQVNGQLKLNKIKKECNEVLDWFVCKSETQTKHSDVNRLVSILPPTKTTIIPIDISSESISNITNMYYSETPRVTSSVHTNEKRDPYKKGNDSETIVYFIYCLTQPGAVIGGVLVACSVIAVLSVLNVCKIRPQGLFTESSNHVYEDTGQVISSKTIYDDVVNNTRNKNTTTASTETYDIHESSSSVYNNIDESKYDNV